MSVHKTCIDSLDEPCKKRIKKKLHPFTRPVSTGEICPGVSSSLYSNLDPSAELFIQSLLCQILHSLYYVGTIAINTISFSTQFYDLPCNDRSAVLINNNIKSVWYIMLKGQGCNLTLNYQ